MQALTKLLAPQHCYKLLARHNGWLQVVTALALAVGLVWVFKFSPPDYQQGYSVRIMYLHVPAAMLSMGLYMLMAAMAALFLVFRINLAPIVLVSAAPIGACFTAIALLTGSLWGKPMWGTYWIWDARLSAELILLFLYFGVLALASLDLELSLKNKLCAYLSLIGAINVPIIHFSVEWWSTLHQKASITKFAKPSIASSMLYPLLWMLAALSLLAAVLVIQRLRTNIIKHQAHQAWVQQLI